jgi:hypothetical protein
LPPVSKSFLKKEKGKWKMKHFKNILILKEGGSK